MRRHPFACKCYLIRTGLGLRIVYCSECAVLIRQARALRANKPAVRVVYKAVTGRNL